MLSIMHVTLSNYVQSRHCLAQFSLASTLRDSIYSMLLGSFPDWILFNAKNPIAFFWVFKSQHNKAAGYTIK